MLQRLKALFLCTGNSCLGQMAEGWARARRDTRLRPGASRDARPRWPPGIIREKSEQRHEATGVRSADPRSARKWLTVYNLGFFLVFLGLFNPTLWVAAGSGADRKVVLMNGLFTALLAALGISVMLAGHRRIARKKIQTQRTGRK